MRTASQRVAGNRIHYAVPAGRMADGDRQFLLVDGILSRANTNINIKCYEGSHVDDAHRYFVAASDHNLETRKFAVQTDSPIYPTVVITALFTTEDIQAGAELRYPYERSNEDVKWCLRGHSPSVRLQR